MSGRGEVGWVSSCLNQGAERRLPSCERSAPPAALEMPAIVWHEMQGPVAKSCAPRWIAARSVHHGARTGADGRHMIIPRPISPMAHTTRPRAIVPMSILLMVAYASVRLSVDHVRERFVILVRSGLRWLDRVRRQAS